MLITTNQFSSFLISLVSNGTAKWFTLITAILTTPSVFAIEEPENFLHPLMQKEIVNIVRNTFSTGDSDAFEVMKTHSENNSKLY
jgi:predicted ATPase